MAAQYNNNNNNNNIDNSTMMLVVDNSNVSSMTNNSMMNINLNNDNKHKYSIPIILNDTTTTTTTTATSNRLHVIAKRKFEKIKNKFAEFFFSSNNSTTPNTNNSNNNSIVLNTNNNNNNNSTNHNYGTRSGSGGSGSSSSGGVGSVRTRNHHKTNSIKKQSQSNNTFSNCYYGYKSDNDNNCNINNNNNHNNNNNQASSVTYPPCSLFNVQTQNYFSTISPFNIDDEEFQANLFDKNFMIDYITYTIISQIKQSDLVRFLHLDLRLQKANMIKDIANQIYSIAEEEPCGLKGCKMSIELILKDSLNKQIENLEQFNQQQQQQNDDSRSSTLQSQKSFQQLKQQPQQQRQNVYELTRFRFDVSNSLTTFELKLCLKEDEKFSFTVRNLCLLFPKNKMIFIDKMTTQSPILLDPTYNLIKRKLY